MTVFARIDPTSRSVRVMADTGHGYITLYSKTARTAWGFERIKKRATKVANKEHERKR